MNLLNKLNQTKFHFYYLSVDPYLTINLPQLTNFHLISSPDYKNSGQLLAASIAQIDQSHPVIVPFKTSAKIEHICRQHHWLLAANPRQLNLRLEDKLKFAKLTQKHNLPHPKFIIDKLTPKNYQLCQQTLGQPLVIQTKQGWAGKSSYLSHTWSDLNGKIPPNTPVKFSTYITNSYTLTINACQSQSQAFFSPTALQITGIPSLTSNPLATVGRQWPSFAPAQVDSQVHDIARQFSQILKPLSYLGFFGLDFIVDQQGKVYLQECNPRLTASFAFYTHLELKAQKDPLFLLHLSQFIGLKHQPNLAQHLQGYQLNWKNNQGKTIKQINRFQALVQSPQQTPTL